MVHSTFYILGTAVMEWAVTGTPRIADNLPFLTTVTFNKVPSLPDRTVSSKSTDTVVPV